VLQASRDCIRLLDVEGRLEFMNDQGKALLEIDDFGVHIGAYWPDVWDPANRAWAVVAVSAAARGEVLSFRSYCQTAKGTAKWWDTTVAPVFDSQNDAVVRLLATSRDVTAEVEMRSFLDTLVNVVPAGLFVKDAADGRYVLANPQAAAMFGRNVDEMLGKTEHDLFPKEQADLFCASDVEVMASRTVHVVDEDPITLPTGEVRYFRTKKVAAYGEGGPRHVIGVSEDVTNERASRLALQDALERTEQANRAKTEFLANMSHEIRTPLNGLVALADMLARSELNGQQAEMVRLIQESSGSLTRLLADLLDVSRMDNGRLELNLAPFDLAELVEEVAASAEQAARDKRLGFRVEWQGSPPAALLGDRARIAQVLTNLLANAVKFTAEGEVVLAVTPVVDGSGPTRIEVRDTGPGFSEEENARLFGQFEKVDGSLTRQFGGSGLGLSICRGLVEQMDGRIGAISEPGQGAVFTVELPLAPAHEPEEAPAAITPALRVLLAEDHPTNRKIIEMIMQAVGADLTAVENGQLAVDECDSRQFDVILMDMQMPVMDGLTATRLIRQRERARGGRTPVICVTANALPEDVEAARTADMDLHLPKPITAGRLLAAINSVLPGAETASQQTSGAAELG
jgi:PAS domain S-box-containing protein